MLDVAGPTVDPEALVDAGADALMGVAEELLQTEALVDAGAAAGAEAAAVPSGFGSVRDAI